MGKVNNINMTVDIHIAHFTFKQHFYSDSL